MSQQVRIKAKPHSGQAEVHNSPARFKVLAAGRRWGKTRLGVNECFSTASTGGRAWWVAPSYKMSEVGWRPVKNLAIKIGGEVRLSDRLIILPGGGEIGIRSADNPDSLRGESLDLVVIDEAAFVKENAWVEALRPALSDRRGRAIMISTPKGRNWFWQAYQRGITDTDWQSWQLPTISNPYISADEVEAARQMLPDRIFRQEYLAEFIEGHGVVFRNIRLNLTAPDSPHPNDHAGHRVVMGVDWGKQNDFTALCVFCADCRQELALDRFNKIDYSFQRQRLMVLVNRWQVGHIEAEANSIGEPNIEELRRAGLPVVAFQTTATSKPPLIEGLALALEQQEAQWLPDTVGANELEAYEMKLNSHTGRPTYGAPDGLHDDTVIARALGWRAATQAPGWAMWAGDQLKRANNGT